MGRLHGNEIALRHWELNRTFHRVCHRPASCIGLDWYSSRHFGGTWNSCLQVHWLSGGDHYLRHRRLAGRGRVLLPASDSDRAYLCVLYRVCALLFWRTLPQTGCAALAAACSASADFSASRRSAGPASLIVECIGKVFSSDAWFSLAPIPLSFWAGS